MLLLPRPIDYVYDAAFPYIIYNGGCLHKGFVPPNPYKPPTMITRTENNAVAFSSTKNEVLDLFFMLAQPSPEFDGNHVRDKVLSAARKNPRDTLKVLLHSRDCRGGKGIRCQSIYGLVVFLCFCQCGAKQHVIDMLMEVLPMFGRYRDIIDLYVTCTKKNTWEKMGRPIEEDSVCAPVRRSAVKCYWEQLESDLRVVHDTGLNVQAQAHDGATSSASISLAAKWITSEKKTKLATFYKMLARRAFPNCANSCERLRKEVLGPLRKRLAMVETSITDKDYEAIDYSKVPSNAMSKYAKTFARNDSKRYREFLSKLNRGETSVKGGRLYPHDIVRQLLAFNLSNADSSEDRSVVEQLEHQWDSMVKDNVNGESLGRTVVLSDVSSSMNGTPMEVSIALGILISSFSAGPFRGHVITFSERPTFHRLPEGERLSDKVASLSRAQWGGNTNLMAVFQLLLDTAESKNSHKDDFPDTLVILSDMQFDEAVGIGGGDHLTTFEKARRLYAEHGLKLPRIVFWNLRNTGRDAFPVVENESGMCLLSGPSPSLLNSLMQGKELTPHCVLKEAVLENSRYDVITYPFEEF